MPWLALGTVTRALADGETVVGSGADADWRVATADLMPSHFVLMVHGLNTSIRPQSAEVVVVVNGAQLDGTYHLLHDGDEIAAGRGRFVYTDDAPAPTGSQRDSAADTPETANAAAYLIDERGGVAHQLLRRSSTLGRDVSNSIVIRDPRASRFHAEVRREAGGFALHSMGAAGTKLNGEEMSGPALLAEGDAIEIAFTTYRFTRGPLATDMELAPESMAMNDGSTTVPTGSGHRMTLESTTQPTRAPASVAVIIVVLGLVGMLVIAGLIWMRHGV